MKRLMLSAVLMLLMLLLSMSAWAATTFEAVLLPEATYAPDTYNVPAFGIPAGPTLGYIKLDRSLWTDPGAHVDWEMWVSLDGGATWNEPHVAGGAVGGVQIDPRTGLPRTFVRIGMALPEPANLNRQVKCRVVVSGGAVTTTISGELRTP